MAIHHPGRGEASALLVQTEGGATIGRRVTNRTTSTESAVSLTVDSRESRTEKTREREVYHG